MTGRRAATILVTALLLLSGCAVTTIDVDVYKGPLANEEHVQIQQFAAMAIGAKPLLTQLRDTLQWPKDEDRKCARTAEYIGDPTSVYDPTSEDWYNSGSFKGPREKPCDRGNPEIVPWNERADRVNQVLSLYEDQDQRGAEPFIDAGIAILDRYTRNIAAFDDPANDAAWSRAEPLFKDPNSPEFARDFGVGTLVLPGFQVLTLSYKHFLGVELSKREKEKLVNLGVGRSRARRVARAYDYFLSGLNPSFSSQLGGGILPRTGSNAVYQDLQTEKILNFHMSILFNKTNRKSNAARQFKSRVKAISSAFPRARTALVDLWRNSIQAYEYASDTRAGDFSDKSGRRLQESYVTLIAKLTENCLLSLALFQGVNVPREVTSGLAKELNRNSPVWDQINQTGCRVDRQVHKKANDSLSDVFLAKPRLAFGALVKAHEWLLVADPSDFQLAAANWRTDRRPKVTREYGVVRGPLFRPDQLQDLLENWVSIRDAAAASAFDRGRLAKGIEGLITEYVAANNIPETAQKERRVKEARRRLSDGLVQFAEKVLFIANNEGLLRLSEMQGPRRRQLDEYTVVLQAVGNSIQVQANELREREVHLAKSIDRAKVEQEALELTLARTSVAAIDGILKDLEGQLETATTDLAKAKENKAKIEKDKEKSAQSVKNFKEKFVEAENAVKDKKSEIKGFEDRQKVIEAVLNVLSDASFGDLQDFIVNDCCKDDLSKMVDEIKKWLGARSIEAEKGSSRKDTLILAKSYFEPAEKFSDIIPAKLDSPRQEVFDAIRDLVNRNQKEVQDIIDEREEELKALEKTKSKVYRDLADAKTGQAKVEKVDSDASKAIRDLTADQTRLSGAMPSIRQKWTEILARSDGAAAGDVPRVAFKLLVNEVQRALEAAKRAQEAAPDDAKKEAKVKALQAAQETLARENPPMEAEFLEKLQLEKGKEETKDVLDKLITVLNHEHVQVIRESGEDSARARNIKASLDAAFAYRGNKIFIRPPVAYLRSSYTATGLQDDPGLTWSNELGHHGLRTSPIFGFVYNKFNEEIVDGGKAKIVADIDKQFWQRINSVRVAGAGETNYVMAKDDVGNWYVKSYSSNPRDIIQSAQSLALFGLSGQFNTNLLDRVPGQDGTGQQDQAPGTLEQFYQRFEAEFAAATEDEYNALREELNDDTLENALKGSWSNQTDFSSELDDAVDEASDEVLDPVRSNLTTDDATASVRGDRMVDALQSVRRFNSVLATRIRSKEVTGDARGNVSSVEAEEARTKLALDSATRDRDLAQDAYLAASQEVDNLSQAETPSDTALAQARADRDQKFQDLETANREFDERQAEHSAAMGSLTMAREALATAQNAEATALANAVRIIRAMITRVADRRRSTLKHFEDSVMFLGRVSGRPQESNAIAPNLPVGSPSPPSPPPGSRAPLGGR